MRLELGNLALYIGRRMNKIKGARPHRTVPSDCDSQTEIDQHNLEAEEQKRIHITDSIKFAHL